MRPALLFPLLLLASPAAAQPSLVAATPANGATAAKVTRLSLTFSEAIAPASGVDLVMTGMPGMKDHPPMPIRGFAATVGADGRSLTAALPRALPAGSYDLTWRAVGADGKPATGTVRFTAR